MPRRGENIHKRKDGRWEGRYIKSRSPDGKAKYGSIYCKSYSETKRKLTEINAQKQKDALPETDKVMAYREVLILWLESSRLKLKPQTYAKYKSMIENHIIPKLGCQNITNINSIIINTFITEKSESGRIDNGGGLSASSVKTLIFIIGSSLKFAASQGFCKPVAGEIYKPPKAKKTINVFNKTEVAILESYLLRQTDCRALGVLFSLYSGLRIGELCALQWNDIDFDNLLIHISHTVSRIAVEGEKKKTKLVLGDTKTFSSDRIIPISAKLQTLLEKRRSRGFVIPGTSYPYTDPRTMENYFLRCLSECGIRKANFHVLRHTFATRCIESGMDVKSLSEILGHSSVDITLNIYVHSSIESKRRQLDAMTAFCGQ